jgi:autotransporter-associated beta strand protein
MKTKLTCMITLTLAIAANAHAGSATWNLNPTSGDWNTAANWTPATVPNGPTDIATFGVSDTTDLSFSTSAIEVSSIVFDPGASSFNIMLDPEVAQASVTLTISGAGILNNSDVAQTLTVAPTTANGIGIINFLNSATAGEGTVLAISGSAKDFGNGGIVLLYNSATTGSASVTVGGSVAGFLPYGAYVMFHDSATAENASFAIEGSMVSTGEGGRVYFYEGSTAANAQFVVEPSSVDPYPIGGLLKFYGHATAANATISVQGTTNSSGDPGYLYFDNSSSAGNAVITAEGGAAQDGYAGVVNFSSSSTAANATCTANGGSATGAQGATIGFDSGTNAGTATLIANGGSNGGEGGGIGIPPNLSGMPRVELYGNGGLGFYGDSGPVTIGSLEGDGLVSFTETQLIVGTNNLSTAFSGVIQDSGSLIKTGTGTFTLSGANTYTDGTTILSGTLRVNNTTGSGTGTGSVQVNAGTLGGTGTIAGPVTIGTGSGAGGFLETSAGVVRPSSLSIQSALTFKADSTYTYNLNTKRAKADKVIANGVTIDPAAQFSFAVAGNKTLTAGKRFIVISNTAATPISGTFANLADGEAITGGSNSFQASYEGGDGNDLTLTVVP